MIKKTLIGIAVMFAFLAVLILRPVPIVSEDKALVERGVVKNIFEGGVKDIVFKLENNIRIFYINRGLEKGLIIEELRRTLVGNEVIIKYPKYWTPLDWNNKGHHISKVETDKEISFNELK